MILSRLKDNFPKRLAAADACGTGFAQRVAWQMVSGLLAVVFVLGFCGTAAAQNAVTTVVPNDPTKPIVGIAVNPTENYVYVTQGDGNITILNAQTNQVVSSSAPNTNGAGAIATYLNGTFVANGVSNNISSYFAVDPSGANGAPFQGLYADPNAVGPTGVALSPNGFGEIYVSNSGSNNVSIFKITASGYTTNTVAVGANPQAIALNQVTHVLYVADFGDNKVYAIDPGSAAVVATYTVGTNPRSIAINEVTNQVFTANFGSNTLSQIDVNSGTVFTGTLSGGGPGALAVNPLTNQVFIANAALPGGNGSVTVFNVIQNSFSTANIVGGGVGQAAIVVDTQTDIAYVSIQGSDVFAVNGQTLAVRDMAVGSGAPSVLALDPVTHKIFTAAIDPLTGRSAIGIIDGSTNVSSTVTPQSNPFGIAVNAATNQIYAVNNGSSSVSVIDGGSNTVTATVSTQAGPRAITVDASKNLIYVSNFDDSSVTIINGQNNQTNTQSLGGSTEPDSLAVNPVLGQVYGAASQESQVFSFQSAFSPAAFGIGDSNGDPIATATNPATGMWYVLYGSRSLDINDGSSPHSFNTGVCSQTSSNPTSMAVNTHTNTVWVTCAGNELDEIQSASGFFGGNEATLQDSNASVPVAVAILESLDRVFVANGGTNGNDGSVSVFDGDESQLIVNIPVNGSPVAIAANEATGKVYVQIQTGQTSQIAVIDGTAGKVLTLITGGNTGNALQQIAANPINGTIYAANNASNTIRAVQENATAASNTLQVVTQPFTNNTVNTSSPTFTFMVSNNLDAAGPYAVYYQVDSQTGVWDFGSSIGNNQFSGTPAHAIPPGFHVVYCYTVNGAESGAYSSVGSTGNQHNPQIGAISAYGFLVAPPIAGVPFYPADFGSSPVGVATAAQQPILVNDGGAPMSFTYNISGPNASDFQDVPSGSGGDCSTRNGTLFASSYCPVNIVFQPTGTGTRTATLTFVDNSLGAANQMQTVTLTGVGQASAGNIPLTVSFAGNGAGSVSDGANFTCNTPGPCTQNYASGTQVTLNATPMAGSIFYGWTGACSGSGPCTVTMSAAQSVTAQFTSSVASSCSANDSIWVGGASGNWSVATNWSTGVVPNNGAHACINNSQSPVSSVTLDISVSIGGLTIDPGNSLTIATGQELVISGTISNAGIITVVSNNSNTFMTFSGAVTLTGGGTITLNQVIGNGQPILRNVNSGSLTNVNNLIQGSGQFGNNGLPITNQSAGVINANGAQALLLNSGNITNAGLIEATNGATLQINVIVANKNGTISASGTNSMVQLASATVQGGTVSGTGGGTIGNPVSGGVTLDGSQASQGPVTLTGTYTVANNGETVVAGTLINTGTISILSNNANSILTFSGAVTLTGGGTVTMSQAIGNGQPILRNVNNGALTNVNNLIQGSGQFGNNGLIITNQAQGIVNANGAFPLFFNNGGVTNQGLLEATAGGVLVTEVTVFNANATILSTGANSAVQLNSGTTIQGGTLKTTSGGVLGGVSTVTLDGSTQGAITISGTYSLSNNTETIMVGTITNNGLISVPSNNANTIVTFSGVVTLNGGGTITMTQAIGNGQPILRNVNNGALMNVNNTIQGAGQFGNNGLLITNQSGGVINANGAFPLYFNNGTVTNLGLVEATAGGTLNVSVLVVNKTATMVASGTGSTINLQSGADIQGGTITSVSGGTLAGTSTVTLDGATQGALTITGTYTVSNNTETVLVGTINNTGTISLISNNANTIVTFNGGVTLTGGGLVTMSQAQTNGQPILRNVNNGALTNVNNLIQGAGQFGNNGLLITNQAAGVINANATNPLALNNGTVTNLGLIEASAGGTLQVFVTVINKGATLLATGSGSAVQLESGDDIEGGTISAAAGGTFTGVSTATFDGTTQGALTINGTYTVSNGTETVITGTINNTGTILVVSNNANTFLTVNGSATLTGSGIVNMSQAVANGQPILRNVNNGNLTNLNNLIEGAGQLGNNGLILGNQGSINANGSFGLSLSNLTFTNAGIMEIDGTPGPTAVATTGYTQTSAGTLIIGVTGGAPAGPVVAQLQNTGVATLGGTLDLLFRNGFTPAVGNSFTVLTSNSLAGQFASIQSTPALPNGLVFSATYNATSVVVNVVQGSSGSILTINGLGAGGGVITDSTNVINCISNAGSLSGVCSAAFQTGSVVTLTAAANASSTFTGWSACTGTGTCQVTLNGPTTVSATFVPVGAGETLTVTPIGTGDGTVTDNAQQINCTTTAGVMSGTCTGTYPAGTVVALTATPAQGSTFGGYLGACTGTKACSVTTNSPQTVKASFVPPAQILTLPFTTGTNETAMATYDCPSNPNPTPNNPCTDPNAHAIAFTLPQVNTPFTLTVAATEVPPDVADGLCPAGDTPTQDFDCRFKSFFTYQTNQNGDTIVPLCYPYANGNCVVYSVYYQTPGTEPDPSWYTGPVDWLVTYNNDSFVAPAPYAGSTPRLYEDPDGFVLPGSPYGTNCSKPMQVGSPGTATNPAIFCQFVFDITTFYDPNKKVDAGIGGKTKVFSDAVVAIPPATAGFVTVTSTPDAATVTAGGAIGFTIAISNGSAATANNVTLNDPLPAVPGTGWIISPAYTGPGTCSLGGALGSQVLNCSFGNVAQNASVSVHVQSPSSSVGSLTNSAEITATNQQVLSVANIVVQAVNVAFSALTPSQSIAAGTNSVLLGGVIGNGNAFPPVGETVGVTINGVTQQAKIVTGGAFQTSFPTANIPASATPYPITYSYPGDSTFGPASDSSTALTVNGVTANFTLTVSLTGTGNGSVFDSTQQISCTDTAGVISGTCSASYPAGTIVQLSATAVQPSTFGGWSGACSGTQACSVTMNSSQSVTASFVPPSQTVTLQFTPGTNETQMATFDCPSNPNPTPANPCLDPNAHAIAFTLPQVNTAFALTVKVTEVPPDVANGLCPAGDSPTQDFDCRFKSFFTYQTKTNGDTVVPLCYPYANGNCVVYSIYSGTPGTEPNPASYTGPVSWEVTFNNDTFVPPAPYAGSIPRLYEDPDGFVLPNSPYGTNCSTPMLVGNPGVATSPAIFCQFVFDITTFYDPNKKVDAGIGGKSKVFSDAVVAIPPATAGFVTVTSTPDAATVTAGNPIGFTIAISNGSAATANNATLNDPLPAGAGINWKINPAYGGPGTCAINGAVGSQVLSCSFGNVAVNAAFNIHLLSASSSTGNYINQSYVTAADQQVLSVVNITVQALPVPMFSGLTPSQTVTFGTASITLGGKISSGTIFPTPGEKVTITIAGKSQQAAIGSSGAFSTSFAVGAIPASTTPYAITYSYAGDAKLAAASDSSTTLTVAAATKKNQTITFGALPTSAAYGSSFPVTASASSGLPVTITGSGACSFLAPSSKSNSGTATMTSGIGTCTLTATQAGNGTYNPATASKTVAAAKANSATKITANTPNPSNVAQTVTVSFAVSGGSVKLSGPTGSVKVTASTGESCNGTLTNGGGSCTLTFATAGPRTLTAAYSGDNNFAGSASNSVSQTVNGGASTLLVSPTSIDFGQVPLGSLGIQAVTLKNTGGSTIKFSNIVINRTGTHPEDFFDLPLCPDSLAPGRSCVVYVSFVPLRNQLGPMNANLVITDNAVGSPQTVTLKGTVINPQPVLSPSSLSFGAQKVGTTSAVKSATLTNNGSSALMLNKISVSGDYSIASATTCVASLSLAPTKTCRIDVKFSPRSRGQRNGAVDVDDNAFPDDQYVQLSGSGN